MVPGDSRILPRRRLLNRFLTEGGVPFTMTRVNIIKGTGPVLQIAEAGRRTAESDARSSSMRPHQLYWPTTLVLRRVLPARPFTDVCW